MFLNISLVVTLAGICLGAVLNTENESIGRIIGGHISEPHSIPYQALPVSYTTNNYLYYCGASLISSTTVLTAGHCIEGMASATIVLGAYNHLISEDTQVNINVNSSNMILHPEFDPDYNSHDIALIQLPSAVEFNEVIQAVPIPSDNSQNYTNKTGTASGWGTRTYQQLYEVLRYLEGPILSIEDCASTTLNVNEDNVCLSGENESNVCYTDIGGPLVVDGVLVGISSFGRNRCHPGYPSVFTRVASYLDFIEEYSK